MSKQDYDVVIGLEIHAELDTKTKIFCACENKFGSEPNTNCCPVCVGMPGALPVLNQKAVELTIKAGLTCGCDINQIAIFERKNYFYPDLSKAYQISQLVKPICIGGGIKLDNGKFIRLNRIHLEEDAGKLIHGLNETYVDYNRGGVPLIESVTEPDITCGDEALEFLNKLRNNFIFANVAKCKMEQGGMRCDVNISVKPKGSSKLGVKTEMKNLNSFKSVARAIDYEAERQIKAIENGEKIIQETRKWDDNKGVSLSMRSKEDSQDYRYFPDPDLLHVSISKELVEKLKAELPLSQTERKEKYMSEYKLSEYDAGVLSSNKVVSDYFDECMTMLNEPKEIANWIMTEIMKLDTQEEIEIPANKLIEIIKLLLAKKLTRPNAKELLLKVLETKGEVEKIAQENNMISNIDNSQIESIIANIIANNPKAVEDYAKTPDKVIQFFIGNLMRETKGKADAGSAREIIIKLMNK